MSNTSGPTVPWYTGRSRLLPALYVSETFPLASIIVRSWSCGAQRLHHLPELRVPALRPSHHEVEQVVVGKLQQPFQRRRIVLAQSRARFLPEPFEHNVQLEQPPPALPLQPLDRAVIHYTARLTSSSLIFPIASVGLRPFGQTSTQFMVVWQRQRRYGSSRWSRRSLVAWWRLS